MRLLPAALTCVLAACGDDPATSADSGGAAQDAPFVFAASDVPAASDPSAAVDPGAAPLPPANHPPSFAKLEPVTLKMGHTTTLDLAPSLSDPEDADAALAVSWSAKHVAMQASPAQVLDIVAPTDWFGVEVITLTVTDLGGMTAKTDLTVTVEEVAPPPPGPTCGEVTIGYAPGKPVTTVLLSGSFNGWGQTADTAWPMLDADSDGTYTRTHVFTPGTYEYKFIVDGAWLADPANPKTTPEFGNSVLDVPPCE